MTFRRKYRRTLNTSQSGLSLRKRQLDSLCKVRDHFVHHDSIDISHPDYDEITDTMNYIVPAMSSASKPMIFVDRNGERSVDTHSVVLMHLFDMYRQCQKEGKYDKINLTFLAMVFIGIYVQLSDTSPSLLNEWMCGVEKESHVDPYETLEGLYDMVGVLIDIGIDASEIIKVSMNCSMHELVTVGKYINEAIGGLKNNSRRWADLMLADSMTYGVLSSQVVVSGYLATNVGTTRLCMYSDVINGDKVMVVDIS